MYLIKTEYSLRSEITVGDIVQTLYQASTKLSTFIFRSEGVATILALGKSTKWYHTTCNLDLCGNISGIHNRVIGKSLYLE
jgi:hypothetical protein